MDIKLPEEKGKSFNLAMLLRLLVDEGRPYIIQGQNNCTLDNHPRSKSLDYWVRNTIAEYPDRKQATNKLVASICETGLFRINKKLWCPDTGKPCKGIELIY
jgi:hypothetical protein